MENINDELKSNIKELQNKIIHDESSETTKQNIQLQLPLKSDELRLIEIKNTRNINSNFGMLDQIIYTNKTIQKEKIFN